MNIQELQTGILDINNKYNIDFSCKQLDDIIIKIIVYDKSVQADLSNYNCRLKAFKSDQVLLIQNTNISIKDNVVTIKASKQLTTTVGIVKAELQFINKTTLEKKSTFYINIEVVASVLDVDGTVSTPTCTILEEIDHKLDEIENISNVLEEAKEVRDELKGTTIPNATNINSNLEDNTNNANNKIIEVKNIISSASNKIEEVKTSIINATNTKDNLAATTKEKIEELKDAATLEKESIISTAFNKIKEVETCINNADSSKKELDLSKTNADISKENLDTANTLAEKNIEELNSLGNVTDLAKNVQTNTTDITKLKTDVEDNTSQLKDCAKNIDNINTNGVKKLIQGEVLTDLDNFLELNTIKSISDITVNKPNGVDFASVINLGMQGNNFNQIIADRKGKIFSRGYASWDTPKFKDWKQLATTESAEITQFQNGWTKYSDDAYGSGLSKVGNTVTISILVSNPSPTTGSTIFVLPQGFRPNKSIIFTINQGTTILEARMYPNGDVRIEKGVPMANNWHNIQVTYQGQ